ncbi:hypothetical protein N566_19335 [Streptomycetaceae bacterium MP113-05]|nr:hypothetical protein N566_19335 [Streptomycetaceae bacterium MP113-05]
MPDALASAVVDFAVLLVELAFLLMAVSALMALVARRAGLHRLQRWLGGGRVSGAAKGLALGFLTPFCAFSAIPLVIGMIKARIRTATLTAFLLSSPLLDPVLVVILVPLFGWTAAVFYVLVTCSGVLLAALIADVTRLDRHLSPSREPVGATAGGGREPESPSVDGGCTSAPDPYVDTSPWRGWRKETRPALRYAQDLVRRLAIPMLISVAVAAAVLGLVPQDLVARLAGSGNPIAVPVAAVLGAPFYVSNEAFLPVAAALHENGMSLGAVFALTISAAGVNVPELALLSRVMKPCLLLAYTLAVVGVAVAAGYLVPLT